MMKSNEKRNEMMTELGNLMNTASPLMMEALGEIDSHDTEIMELVITVLRMTKLSKEFVQAYVEESEENDRRMKRIEEKLDTIIDRSGDINSVVHETRTVVYGIRENTKDLMKRTSEE